jgi:hypothetical protein
MKAKKQKKAKLAQRSNSTIVKPQKVNLNEDQRYILLCNIVDYLGSYGITKNKEISELANVLLSHDKLRGIKRSNTCYRKKVIGEKSKFNEALSSVDNNIENNAPVYTEYYSSNKSCKNNECKINPENNNQTKTRLINQDEINVIIGEIMSFMKNIKLPSMAG